MVARHTAATENSIEKRNNDEIMHKPYKQEAVLDLSVDVISCRANQNLMTEVVSTSETSVNFYETTRRNIQKDIFILAAMRT
jgi:hypothetical protein